MTLDELIESLNEIKENHPTYGRVEIIRITKTKKRKVLKYVMVNICNTKFNRLDGIKLEFV